MINPYLIIALLLAWLASVVGVGYWQHSAGVTATTLAYAKRDNADLAAANSKIKALEETYRLAEQLRAAQISNIADTYEKELKNANDKTTALIAAARAGTVRLHDPQAARLPADGSHTAQTITGPGGCDDQAGAELSEPSAEFLLALTGEADDVTRQLGACQAVVRSDRATIGRQGNKN